MTTSKIEINLTDSRKEKPNEENLAFGRHFTDHMFIADYVKGIGWQNYRIVPYAPISLDPAAIVFHYGQTVFEGLKAYRAKDNSIRLFRPEENFKRLNRSLDRLCMPQVNEAKAIESLLELLEVEEEWVPKLEGNSLYIRPFVIATEAFLGVAPATTYQFYIILSPVGSYYEEGIHPVKILVENEFVRAVKGGTGGAKTAGNYASALKAQETASAQGYSQVMWLDGVERKYVEEVGSMNIFFMIDGEVITPSINGSILEGITRKSIIQLLAHWGIPVTERKISMQELAEAHAAGKLEEVFGTGTAAVISPVGELNWNGNIMTINEGKTGTLSKKIYDTLTKIQVGDEEDTLQWVTTLSPSFVKTM